MLNLEKNNKKPICICNFMLMSALRGQLMAEIIDFVIGYQRTLEFKTSNDLKGLGNEISISFLLVISSTLSVFIYNLWLHNGAIQ